jgi:Glycosyl hydrolases family 43/FG-GAP-like repeat
MRRHGRRPALVAAALALLAGPLVPAVAGQVAPAAASAATELVRAAVTRPATAQHDLDRDGAGDVLAVRPDGTLLLYRGNGASGWAGTRTVATGWASRDQVRLAGDLDRDGDSDVLSRTTGGYLWMNPGDGRGGVGASRRIGTGWQGFREIVAAGDRTGDGIPDVLALRSSDSTLHLYRGTGAGTITYARQVGTGWGKRDRLTAAGDLTSDGRADLVARDTANGDLWLYPGDGRGGFAAGSRVIGRGWASMTAVLSSGDADRDGRDDVLARTATGALMLYRGDGRGGWAASGRQIGSGWGGLGLGGTSPAPYVAPKVPVVTSRPASPAWNDDAPDPHIVQFEGRWYAYSTGTTWGNNLGVLVSDRPDGGWRTTTGKTWGSTALPSVPSWQHVGTQWAPAVYRYAGKYVMFYAARVRANGQWCLSVATASTPAGPFTDRTTKPIVCQSDGTIDPHPFVDAQGRAWLHFKNNDGINESTVSRVWAVRLGADGTTVASAPTLVMSKNSQAYPWQTTVDNPQMVLVNGQHYLFHTGGDYIGNATYATGYALCAGPLGPCTTAKTPLTSSYGSVAGPGGGTVARGSDGRWWLSYHAWAPGCYDYWCGGKRRLYVAPLAWR